MTCVRRLAGAPQPASSAPAGSPSRPEPRSGRSRVRLFRFLPFLALLLGALGLFHAAPAQAQVEVWSATLTVQFYGHYGCDNDVAGDECSSASVLTDDDFTIGSDTWEITDIRLPYSSGVDIELVFNRDVRTALDGYELCVSPITTQRPHGGLTA